MSDADVSHDDLVKDIAALPADARRTLEEHAKLLRLFAQIGGCLATMAMVLVVSELAEEAHGRRH